MLFYVRWSVSRESINAACYITVNVCNWHVMSHNKIILLYYSPPPMNLVVKKKKTYSVSASSAPRTAGSAGVGQSRGSTRRAARHQPGRASQCRSKSPCHSDTLPGSAPPPSAPGSRSASSWSESHPGHQRSDETPRPRRSEEGRKTTTVSSFACM